MNTRPHLSQGDRDALDHRGLVDVLEHQPEGTAAVSRQEAGDVMRPLDRNRPGGPKTTRATNHQHHDQQATRPADAVCESSAGVDNRVEISFAEHLARIGYDTDTPEGAAERMSLCQQSPGSRFSYMVSVWSDVPARAARLVEMSSMNLWFGVNALREVLGGRGTADDVIRVAG